MSSRKNHSTHRKLFFGVVAAMTLCFLLHTTAHAATLSISPSNQNVSAGKTFSVRIVVNSNGQSVNAVSGSVTFSQELLTLTSISKSGSVVSLWAQAPTYSNTSGTASFQGVILNGYTGSSGTVLTLLFKAKTEGVASIGLSAGGSSVLLNDGQGTNVLSNTSGGSVIITKGSATTQANSEPTVPVVVTPPPHPVVELPVFTEYQNPLVSNNYIVAKGTATPNTTITITLTEAQADGTTTVIQTPIVVNTNGTFTYVSDNKASAGSYSLVATDSEGRATTPLSILVKNAASFVVLSWITAVLSVKVPLAIALILLILIVWVLVRHNIMLKKRLNDAINKIHELETK